MFFSMAYYGYYGSGDMMDTGEEWHKSLMALNTQLSELNNPRRLITKSKLSIKIGQS